MMSDWMKEARAKARELDQSTKKNSYKERLHQAGESARKNGLAPKPVQTAAKVQTANTETKPVQMSKLANNYLLSDNLKTAGENMKNAANAGQFTNAELFKNGEFANAAVNNLRANGQTEAADNLKSQLDALERERHIAELRANRSSVDLQDNGQPGKQRTAAHTIIDTINEGAGLFNQAVFSTADFVANAIPRIEGIVFNEKPEATFTGQVLRPLTDVTGWLVDWAKKDTAASHQRVQADTANNKVANTVVSFAPSVVAALPNAALAFMSGGASVGGQLAAQSTGLSGTVATAASKMLHNPMTAVSFAQMLGPGYDQAKDRGANDAEAMTAATISALFNTIVEVSGGIETLPVEIRNVDLSNAQKAWKWVTSALGEGKEEVVQGVVSEMTNKAVFEENKPLFSLQDETAVINPERMAKEFGGGTAIGGILGGGQILTDGIINKTVGSLPRISMADFTNRQSDVFNNIAYEDVETQIAIMQKTHQEMVESGSIVEVSEDTLTKTEEYYPDLRHVKKKERNPILKQKIAELKGELRTFLNGLKGTTYEFEVNGNILDARLYDTGVEEVMEKIKQDKASMLFHSDDIFQNAQYMYSTPDYEGNPNIYRWNYFYTPVQIGEDIVGVRIAVRDMAKTNESQIYNWNIKKNATLGGEGRGQSRIPDGASSDAFLDTALGGGGDGNTVSRTGASSAVSNSSISKGVPKVKGMEGDFDLDEATFERLFLEGFRRE